MADRRSEHLIRIVVQGVNRLGDVVDKGTRAVEKHTAAVKKQDKAIESSARTAADAQEDFKNFTKTVAAGEKDYEAARLGLTRLAAEMDKLAKKEPLGSKLSEDLNRSAINARNLAKQLEQSIKSRLKLETDAAKQRDKIEQEGVKQRKKLVADLLDEVRRDSDEREKMARDLADIEIKESVRSETERQKIVLSGLQAEQAAEKRAADNRRGFLADILAEVQRDHDERVRLGQDLERHEAQEHQARLKRLAEASVAHAQLAAARASEGQVTTLGRGVPIAAPSAEERADTTVLGGGDRVDRPLGARGLIVGRIKDFIADIRGLGDESDDAGHRVSRLDRAVSGLSSSATKAGFSVARVNSNLQGLAIVGVLAFSQQLISAMVALAGAALAVASAAAQAAAAIGGAFVASVGQAVPTIGLLIAAFGRIGAVFEAVGLFNDQATKSGYDQAQAAEAQAAAADRVVSAQEGVVSASQRVQDATDALTKARERAIQRIKDLDLAERSASLRQFEAGQAISQAVSAGDVGALEGLRIQRDEANLAAGRTSKEATEARTAGPDRAPEVLAAVRDLNEANAALRRARREADAAGRAAKRAAETGSAADRSLEQALAQLTPAELALYEAAKRIQARFKTIFRPITDIIVTAFAGGVDRAAAVLGDSRIVDTATNMANAIADSIGRISDELTSERGLNFFQIMGDEAAKNIPLLTTLFIRINRIMSAIALAGGPALTAFIDFFNDLALKGQEATNSTSGIAKLEAFFLRGEEMAESFGRLGLSIIQLFLALAGAGGAEEGISLVEDLTASIQEATRWVEDHQDKVAKFFEDVGDTTRTIAGVLLDIGKGILSLFDGSKVDSFAAVFREVLLPALINVSAVLGEITHLFSLFLSLPGVSQIAQLALSVGLLFKALSFLGTFLGVLGGRFASLAGGLGRFGPILTKFAGGLRIAAAVLTGPIGLAIAAVITAIVLLDRKFHFIRPTIRFLGEVFEWLAQKFKEGLVELKPVGEFIGTVLSGAFKVAMKAIQVYLDVWLGFITTMLGGLSTLASVASKLPGVGGEFKKLGDFIDGVRNKVDGWRESIRGLGEDQKKALKPLSDMQDRVKTLGDSTKVYNDIAAKLAVAQRDVNKAIKDGTSPVSLLRLQVRNLTHRMSLLDSGSQEYKDTAVRLREKQRELNGAVADAGPAARKGARGIKTLGETAEGVAKTIDAANLTIVEGYNQLYGQLGGNLKKLVYRTGKGSLGVTKTNPALDRATGGWIGRKGGPQGPDNRLIRAGDGEAVLAVPHQPIVEQALKLRSAFMGGPGSLDEMFGRVKGYVGAFAKGGRVGAKLPNVLGAKPGFAVFMQMFQRMFGSDIFVMSGSRPGSRVLGSGRLSNHSAGNAIDISNPRSAGGSSDNPPPRTGLDALHGYIKRHLPFLDLLWRTTAGGNHFNHIHWGAPPAITATIDAARRFIAKLPGGASTIGALAGALRIPKISGPKGATLDFANALVKKIGKAANDKLDNAGDVAGSFLAGAAGRKPGDPGEDGGNIIKLARHAAYVNRVKWVESIVRVLLRKESGGGKNFGPSGPLRATGPFQVIPSTFAAYALPGHKNIRDPYDNALAAFAYIRARYKTLPNLARVTGLLGDAYKGYKFGGKVTGSGPQPRILHGDEHVWTAGEVAKSGGHRVMYALRRMLGGGGQGGPDGYQDGGQVFGSTSVDALMRKFLTSLLSQLRDRTGSGALRGGGFPRIIPDIGTSDASESLNSALRSVARVQRSIAKMRTRASKFARDFGRAVGQITDDNGLLDQATEALNRLTAGTARRLKRLAFRVQSSGLVVRQTSARQDAEAQVGAVDQQLAGLQRIRGTAADSLDDVDRRLTALRRGGISSKERKAFETLNAARRSLVLRLESLDGQIADTIESRFQAQEAVLQATIDEVAGVAQRGLARADLSDRLASLAEGLVGGAAGAFNTRGRNLQARGDILTTQRNSLLPLLAQAQAQGSTSIINDLVGQIEELNVAIAENSAAVVQNTVAARSARLEAISRIAQRAATRADLTDRVASLVEASGNSAGAFNLRGIALRGRADSLADQRNALGQELKDARRRFAGTVAEQQQIDDLTDQMADLGVQIDENAQAVRSNTIAARQASIDAITNRGGFLGSVFSGLSGIVKALGQLSGGEDITRLRELTQIAGQTLQQTGEGLRQQLAEAFGVDLRGLDQTRLVDALRGLDFDAIEARLDVEGKRQFEGLIGAIIDNASAVVDNTQQLSELNGSTQQSFSTTAWQLFREAIFNGSGGLLPQYRMLATTPTPAMLSSSQLSQSTSTRTTSQSVVDNSVTNVNLTSPTETTDPNWIGEVLATKRSLAKAV